MPLPGPFDSTAGAAWTSTRGAILAPTVPGSGSARRRRDCNASDGRRCGEIRRPRLLHADGHGVAADDTGEGSGRRIDPLLVASIVGDHPVAAGLPEPVPAEQVDLRADPRARRE